MAARFGLDDHFLAFIALDDDAAVDQVGLDQAGLARVAERNDDAVGGSVLAPQRERRPRQ